MFRLVNTKLEQPAPGPDSRHVPAISAWAAGVACWSFFLLTVLLLKAYSILHLRILYHQSASVPDALKPDLFHLLMFLQVYHLTALFAVVFGLWTFFGQPHWLRWVCLPCTLLSLVMFIILI